jgi:hypothetical protein
MEKVTATVGRKRRVHRLLRWDRRSVRPTMVSVARRLAKSIAALPMPSVAPVSRNDPAGPGLADYALNTDWTYAALSGSRRAIFPVAS